MDHLPVTGFVSSVGAVSPNSGLKFKWEINQFSNRTNEPYGFPQEVRGFRSPTFTENSADGNSKALTLCLLQYTEDLDEFGAFHVQLLSTTDFRNGHSFTILNDTGVTMTKSTVRVGVGGLIKGDAVFISDDFIQDFVHEDTATILCEISMPPSEEMELHEEEQVPSVQETYEALFNNAKFTDVSLISEGKTVKAHKCILANSSSVFAAMFEADMREKQENSVEIPDVKYDVLVEMVRFIYSQKVNNNMDALVGELVVAADKYALHELKNTCEKSMVKKLSIDNVLECLRIADRIHLDKLKEKAIKFIVENSSHITDKPEFKSVDCNLLYEICRAMSKKMQL